MTNNGFWLVLCYDVCFFDPKHLPNCSFSAQIAHSGFKPSSSMSLSTHSFQVFLFLLLHLAPTTFTFLQADTQSFTLLCSFTYEVYLCLRILILLFAIEDHLSVSKSILLKFNTTIECAHVYYFLYGLLCQSNWSVIANPNHCGFF